VKNRIGLNIIIHLVAISQKNAAPLQQKQVFHYCVGHGHSF